MKNVSRTLIALFVTGILDLVITNSGVALENSIDWN
jgi:hypothetical protein